MISKTLYTCLIDEHTEDEAFVQVYWSHAAHIGAAIEKMIAAAYRNGLTHPEPRQLDPYDIKNVKGVVVPGSDSETFWSKGRYYFPPEPVFTLPYGVIGSCLEGDHDLDAIIPGYTRHKDKQGKTTIEVNVEREDLLPLYDRLLKLRDTYRVFWYLIHNHWDDTKDQFLVNETLSKPKTILAHLAENKLDSISNGYVTLTAFNKEGATNLNISDHKRIIILTYSDKLASDYCSALKAFGYSKKKELVSIQQGIHHWHFRHPKSHSRSGLVKHLRSIGFTDWHPKTEQQPGTG
jgi:hypothetical protein